MPCVLVYPKGQRGLRLFESFQMKMPRPAKKATINPTVTTPAITTLSKNMLASHSSAVVRWVNVNQCEEGEN